MVTTPTRDTGPGILLTGGSRPRRSSGSGPFCREENGPQRASDPKSFPAEAVPEHSLLGGVMMDTDVLGLQKELGRFLIGQELMDLNHDVTAE